MLEHPTDRVAEGKSRVPLQHVPVGTLTKPAVVGSADCAARAMSEATAAGWET